MTRILHVTPHLGGGVGKAVSGLIEAAIQSGSSLEHAVVCLEQPEKTKSVDVVKRLGCPLMVRPSAGELRRLIETADIVQLEFWNHPATPAMLCSHPLPPMRLCIWCHVSGLHSPRLPPDLIHAAQKLLFTSACSFEADEVKAWLASGLADKLAIISSGGGLESLPAPRHPNADRPLAAGYLGSLNPAKLHPNFVQFAAAVRWDGFAIRMIGDETNRPELERQCVAVGKPDLLEFRGYTADVAAELAQLDVLVYLLNPTHYGTAENALLEAMAMGVVPIVLNNACERHIVENARTGIVLEHPADLPNAMDWLASHPEERRGMGQRASDFVRQNFQYRRMAKAFSAQYAAMMDEPKQVASFLPVFGRSPAQWYRAFLHDTSTFRDDGTVNVPDGMDRHGLFERSKGSVFHFLRYFPDDPLLGRWAQSLGHAMTASHVLCEAGIAD